MIPVVPYQVRRAEDGRRGQLLLRLRHGNQAYIVELPLEQARHLAVEMQDLLAIIVLYITCRYISPNH